MAGDRRRSKDRVDDTSRPKRPTQVEIQAARDKTVPDVIGPGLKVLFCGINPSLYSAAVGHHFARPGNRFWPALHAGGLTERILSPSEDEALLTRGYGITNVVDRATATADALANAELVEGARSLTAKVDRFRPKILAVLGVSAYRTAFGLPKAVIGRQETPLGPSLVWVLPNPSGLNAHYRLADLGRLYGELTHVLE